VAGEASPAPQTLRITSSGDGNPAMGGALNWTAELDPNATWVTLSQTTGITPTVIAISVNTAGLAARTYNAVLTVTALGASNSPQVFPISLSLTVSPSLLPRIDTGGVGNAANFRSPVAAGSLATLFGANLGGPDAGESAGFLPGTQQLPRILRGVRVILRETGAQLAEAPILFVSNRQINFQMPYEMAGRSSVQIVVDNNGVQSAPETVSLALTAPGLFTFGSNRAVVLNQDFSVNQQNNAAAGGTTILAYLTGGGIATPGVGTGVAAPLSPLSTISGPASATIGGVPARVAFLGLAPGFVGLVQANIEVAPGTPAGEQLLLITIGGQAANAAIVSIR
jgi:uncharacterized protein (TIGR03437 family)